MNNCPVGKYADVEFYFYQEDVEEPELFLGTVIVRENEMVLELSDDDGTPTLTVVGKVHGESFVGANALRGSSINARASWRPAPFPPKYEGQECLGLSDDTWHHGKFVERTMDENDQCWWRLDFGNNVSQDFLQSELKQLPDLREFVGDWVEDGVQYRYFLFKLDVASPAR